MRYSGVYNCRQIKILCFVVLIQWRVFIYHLTFYMIDNYNMKNITIKQDGKEKLGHKLQTVYKLHIFIVSSSYPLM